MLRREGWGECLVSREFLYFLSFYNVCPFSFPCLYLCKLSFSEGQQELSGNWREGKRVKEGAGKLQDGKDEKKEESEGEGGRKGTSEYINHMCRHLPLCLRSNFIGRRMCESFWNVLTFGAVVFFILFVCF